MENRCMVYGVIIPEGRQTCPNCDAGLEPMRNVKKIRKKVKEVEVNR